MKRLALLAFGTLAFGALLLLATKWPFSRERMIVSLERMTASRMRLERYHMTFFPFPGCVAEDVEFLRDGSPEPLAHIHKLTIEGSWMALLTFQHRLLKMRPEGMTVTIPDPVPPAMHLHPPPSHQTVIGEFDAAGATLRVRGKTFDLLKLKLYNLARNAEMRYEVTMKIPDPPGTVVASGTLGPWKGRDTPLRGSFRLHGADLARYEDLQGTIEAQGRFHGVLDRILTEGEVNLAGFRVRPNSLETAVNSSYFAAVDGTTGETMLQRVEARFLGTRLSITGEVGRHTSLDFEGAESRIQDLLQVFAGTPEPPLSGPINFHAHVELPPGDTPFLRKLSLDGTFRIDDAQFRRRTQDKVETMSWRARGKDEDQARQRVRSEIDGTVRLRSGVARFDQVGIRVPGARAIGAGTFDLISKRVDLNGKVAMEATLSEATSGMKSFFLAPLNIFFRDRKHGAGAVLPVSLKGIYPHARARVSLKP